MRILVALDQSPFATKVLEKALLLAKHQTAALTIMTVAEDFMDIGDYMDTTAVTDKLFQAAKKAAEGYAAKAKAAEVEASVVVEQGVSPANLIISQAESGKFDLIVMGHQGKSGLSRFLIGSVASRVVSHAPCSVLVIR
ncbi:UspA domain-containing protein [Solidesulfovibrio carbinoliphilus subsp. oakridgensis]|uniref:Universal stress protein n=1 Tax=Solidesulfovibrio carbinoliphilus subsp. oakridgensis TaxID=694327 RepID=G7Q540_9BACT|nr:universal stress protein [Solidesulfovibrio carbinoliphilus]EHJ48363.1 UspA domain-containing protein [Solidesulfovibrio carbinoliphilus subsp. oakridgensis]